MRIHPSFISRRFQSTRPLRGATSEVDACCACWLISIHAPLAGRDKDSHLYDFRCKYFNPRAPCGARRQELIHRAVCLYISIHAPLAGRDAPASQSTSAARISIHAPLAGRDCNSWNQLFSKLDFNPRAPCGARLNAVYMGWLFFCHFNPRAPCGARLGESAGNLKLSYISIHAPLAGRDFQLLQIFPILLHFNPRAPCGARR